MRIIPTFLNPSILQINNQKSRVVVSTNVPNNVSSPLAPLAYDTVSFGRTAEHAELLRKLMQYEIPDMYSGKTVIDPKYLEYLYSKHAFSKNIRNVVKILKPMEDGLHTVERQFFSIVKGFTKINPNYKLEDVVHKIAPEYNRQLIEIQQPIFEELTEMSHLMPKQQKEDFDALMDVIHKKVNYEPIMQPFSAKEFQYKLQRIADDNASRKNPVEIDILKKMIQLAKKMPEKTQSEADAANIKSRAKRNRKIKQQRTIIRRRADILTQIEMLRTGTLLKSDKDLTNLFAQTRSKIYNLPLVVPFNRKSFIYELQKITNTLEDKKFAHCMVKVARKLPTSHENLAAFVMKCQDYSSDKIGYCMVNGSAGSIEHLLPYSKKGKDCIENYGITTAYYNSERGERSMAQQLILHPEAYENCQKQVDKLIELHNNGVFKKIGLSKYYIQNFARMMYKLSPDDNKLVLNLDKLK